MVSSSFSTLSSLHSMPAESLASLCANPPIENTKGLFGEIFSFLSEEDSQSASKGLQHYFSIIDQDLPYKPDLLCYKRALPKQPTFSMGKVTGQVFTLKKREKGLGALLIGLHGDEMALKVFSFLDVGSLSVNARVSSNCNKLGQHHILWNIPKWLKLFSFPETSRFSPKKRWLALNPAYKNFYRALRDTSRVRGAYAEESVFHEKELELGRKELVVFAVGSLGCLILKVFSFDWSNPDVNFFEKELSFLLLLTICVCLSSPFRNRLEGLRTRYEEANERMLMHVRHVREANEECRALEENRLN